MAETKHSPAPWTKVPLPEGFLIVGGSTGPGVDPYEIATVEREEDANLVEAAPDLLAACENLVLRFQASNSINDDLVIEEAKIVLAKAKGENIDGGN